MSDPTLPEGQGQSAQGPSGPTAPPPSAEDQSCKQVADAPPGAPAAPTEPGPSPAPPAEGAAGAVVLATDEGAPYEQPEVGQAPAATPAPTEPSAPAPHAALAAQGGDEAGAAGPTDEGAEATEEPEAAPGAPRPARPTVIVRYGLMGSIGEFRHNLDSPPARGTRLVVRTERGVELGEVVCPVSRECQAGALSAERLRQFAEENGPEYPMRRDGRVLRAANPQDVIDYRHLRQSAREAATYCRQQIKDLRLTMKLVTVEHLLGGERIIFYFSAEQRVDFRELVRRLAGQYRTRIEMRQVGARDEARLVGDYERCGQQCCCQSFLKYLKPVSMRMAKTQKATLDPSKISGRCGRLMCCLRYEDATYEELRKRLPRRNTWVRTAQVVGRVVDAQIITQLVRLQLADGTLTAASVEDIVERDVPPPPVAQGPAPSAAVLAARKSQAAQAAMAASYRPAEAPAPPEDGEPAREEPLPAKTEAEEAVAAQAEPSPPGPEGAPADRKKRRRRRRGKGRRPDEAPGSGQPSPPTPGAPAPAAHDAGGDRPTPGEGPPAPGEGGPGRPQGSAEPAHGAGKRPPKRHHRHRKHRRR